MNTSETTKEVLEEFEILGGDDLLENWDDNPLMNGHLTRGFDYPETARELDPDKVKDFIKNSHIKLLENEIERLEKKKIKLDFKPVTNSNQRVPDRKWAYNQAIEDQITHYKEQIELIKNSYETKNNTKD